MNRLEHLIDIVAEESAEVGQRASKALRFTLDEIQPGQPLTNAQRLVREYWDLKEAMHMLRMEAPDAFADLEDEASEIEHRLTKRGAVEKHLLLSAKVGALDPLVTIQAGALLEPHQQPEPADYDQAWSEGLGEMHTTYSRQFHKPAVFVPDVGSCAYTADQVIGHCMKMGAIYRDDDRDSLVLVLRPDVGPELYTCAALMGSIKPRSTTL